MEIKPVTQDTIDFCSLINAKGDITGVNDAYVEYSILEDYKVIILGGVPFIYDNGVYVPDRTGADPCILHQYRGLAISYFSCYNIRAC